MGVKFQPLVKSGFTIDKPGSSGEEVDPIFSASEAANFEDGDKNKLDGIESGAEVNNISDTNATDLTDGGATTLHKHSYSNLDDKPTIPDELSDLTADSTHRTVTDTEKSTWNGKQDVLGFTPENISNKATDFSTIDNTRYPTVQAVNTAINSAVTGLLDYRGSYDASTNVFPSTGGSGLIGAILKGDFWVVSVVGTLGSEAVSIGDLVIALTDTPGQTSSNWDLISNTLGYSPENSANKENTTIDTSTTKYPTVNLLKTGLATKAVMNSETITEDKTPTSSNSLILCNSTSSITINLSASSSSSGLIYYIKNINTGVVLINPNESETIEDRENLRLENKYDSVIIGCSGASWYILAGKWLSTLIIN